MKTGDSLEMEVERIFKLLGAHTKRRVLIDGYEIDVLVSFVRGPIEISQLVECKEYGPATRVSDLDIRSFAVKLTICRQNGIADRGVFVSTNKYAKTALATAAKYNIKCLTLEELRNQLIDVKEYIESSSKEFAQSDLSNWYVDQTGSDIEDYDSLLGENATKYLHSPLTQYVDHIFFRDQSKRLALLGNFGTGKTSFCMKYRDILMTRYKADSSQRIPILISLRDYRSGIDIHQAITGILQRLPGLHIDLKLFLELQRMGRFFFLLDGLDEMATKVDRTVINESLREINRLLTEGDNLYLLTCRTHFFQERIADEFLKDYRVVYLADCGPPELELYLQKRFGGSAGQRYLKQIQSTGSLNELSKTPLLVDMILKSLSKFEEGEEINIRKLYAKYTDEWIIEQSKRRGAVMSTHQRRRFTTNLAMKLLTETRIDLHFSELYEVAREFSGYGDATRLDYFDTDARTCTFIVKDSKGNYGFRYRSFMEFFCASGIVAQLNNGNSSILAVHHIPKEILEFIEVDDLTELGEKLLQESSAEFANATLSKNSLSILLKLGKPVPSNVEEQYGVSTSQWDSLRKAVSFADEKASEEFINMNWEKMRTIAERLISRMEFHDYDPDDLVNEAIIRLWIKGTDIPEGLDDVRTTSYLHGIMRNILIDRYRLAKAQKPLPLEDIDLEPIAPIYKYDLQKQIELNELRQIIIQELDSAPISQRTKRAFIARFFEDKSSTEIATELGMSVNAVRISIFRGQKLIESRIRPLLEHYRKPEI